MLDISEFTLIFNDQNGQYSRLNRGSIYATSVDLVLT